MACSGMPEAKFDMEAEQIWVSIPETWNLGRYGFRFRVVEIRRSD